MTSNLCSAVMALLFMFTGPASSQVQHTQPDLVFPKEARELSFFSPIEMGIWKPEGVGPFPAIILVHSCGGMKQQLALWRKESIKRGYVAFVIDAFTSRGSKTCLGFTVSTTRGAKDVLDAAAHLKTLPFVDKTKIATIGFSWGAMVGLLAGSTGYTANAAPGLDRVASAVALYPSCYNGPFGGYPAKEFLRSDLATPTLLLLGENDTETPPDECLSRAAGHKERVNPLEVHVFKAATHCWDCSDQNGQRWSPPWAGGRQVVYSYDSSITEQSVERAFEFLGRQMKTEPRK